MISEGFLFIPDLVVRPLRASQAQPLKEINFDSLTCSGWRLILRLGNVFNK
jgi:hypothetical protein